MAAIGWTTEQRAEIGLVAGAFRIECFEPEGRTMTDNEARHLRTTTAIGKMKETRIRHPLNSNSEVFLKRISRETGLERLALYIARVPPGKESFAYHKHERNKEFIYILSGRGIAQIGDAEFEIGAGDFMGFPAPDDEPHHMVNPYEEDLLYLMAATVQRRTWRIFRASGKGWSLPPAASCPSGRINANT